jgi:membrane protease YdiL (CAAX protease family)
MNNFFFRDLTPQKGVFFAIALAIVGVVIFFFIGIIFSALYTGNWDLSVLLTPNYDSESGLMSIRIMQIFQTFGMFIFPAITMGLLASENFRSFLGFNRVSSELLGLSILMMILMIPGINLIASLNAKIPVPEWMYNMEQSAERLIKALLLTEKPGILFLNILVVAVLPAIGEELFFRSLLQKYFCKITNSVLAGVVITSLIFSAIHFQFLGFFPRFLLGMIFGYLYVWTGTIWIPIVVHFVNNCLAVVVYFLIGKGIVPSSTETIGDLSDMWQLGIISLVLSSAIIWLIWQRKVTTQNQQSPSRASEDL